MKRFCRVMSAVLTAIMFISCFVGVVVFDTSAAAKVETTQDKLTKYLTTVYDTPEKKLATMKLALSKDGYELYVDEMSGETAVLDKASGQIMFSNPYDIATSKGSASTKEQIMSQIFVKYVDNGNPKTFYSFVEAGYRDQIVVKNIKGGLRVEYTIGREETRMLVPRYIEKSRAEEVIFGVAEAQLGSENFTFKKLKAYYVEKDPEKATSERAKQELYAAFPITKKMPIYVFDPTASETELRKLEEIIKTYCPLYTYEELDKDHEKTEYEGSDRAPALFKMALEYTLDENGLLVRLPANGIRFDESEYQLNYISILPYMAAGANYAGSDKTKTQTGYTFYPDGSGSIFRFEQLADMGTTTISGNIYGADYAYQTITGAHQETIRYPAFGLVCDDLVKKSEMVTDADGKTSLVTNEVVQSRGYVAVIEEGDSLAQIYTYHAGSLSKYNTMQMMFYPRPTDTYNMKDAISVGTNSEVTVVSERKYVGNYKIRYFMLTDDNVAEANGITKYYETSWLGMATAYREYLEANGQLKRLADNAVKSDIPLYIETFGAVDTVEKFLSIPYNTKVALTSFADIATMYDKLASDGISNINFKLTGYANGGMYSTVPYQLDWEKSVGGKKGFNELTAYATEKDFGVYPDFDFVYAQNFKSFDGINTRKHLVKTIDNRYTSKREYSATYQTFVSYFQLAISPAYFSRFYEKFTQNYKKYDYMNISVSTLGTDLNSDFDEDEPYNREDSKGFTVDALAYLDENYNSVMTTGGNAYTWKYVDHILGVSLDSSRYNRSSNSVPFIGVVLHGFVQFAGSALNMEGNIGYAKLRTIENGAAPYFILSYDNTTLLKDDSYLSKYYSVRFDIWYDELVEIYNELNSILNDVQTKLIVSHEFLVGERVADEDEIEADIIAAEKALEEALEKADKDAVTQAIKDILNARQTAKNNSAKIEELLETVKKEKENAIASSPEIEKALLDIPAKLAEYEAAQAAEAEALAAQEAATEAKTKANDAYKQDISNADLKQAYNDATAAETAAKKEYSNAKSATTAAQKSYDAAKANLVTVLAKGTTASENAVQAAEQAEKLSKEAEEASKYLNGIKDITAEVKSAAAEYAQSANKNAAEVIKIAGETTDAAAVAIAISAENTINSLIETATKAATTAVTRATDTKTKYENLLKAQTSLDEARAAKEEALKALEEAENVYNEAKAKAALDTATNADKTAASEAGVAMNEAQKLYESAAKTVTSRETSLKSATTALKNSLQKVLDEKNKAITAKATSDESIKAAREAMDSLTNVSKLLKDAATDSYNAAVENAKGINESVESATASYAEVAELVKDYVVIEEVVEEPEPEVVEPVVTEPVDGEEGDEEQTTTEEPVEEEQGNQLYADYEYTKYTNDNGNIVKVTYGDSDGHGGYIPYKTFILNYNFFDVTVVLDGVTYTIPESGYVVFYH